MNTVNLAIDQGINCFDMVASEAKPYDAYARAFAGRREKVYLQMYFGAIYDGGKYGWGMPQKSETPLRSG